MLTLIKNINLINLAARNQKLSVKINTNSSITKVLGLLTDYNLIEYEKLSPYSAFITLKYKNHSPCLKSIRFMGGRFKNNITCKYAIRELHNKKAFYIIRTSRGLVTLENAIKYGEGGIILFKIKI